MDDDIPTDLRDALVDRFNGWELVELLDIDIEDVVEIFSAEIMDNLIMLYEEMRMNQESRYEEE